MGTQEIYIRNPQETEAHGPFTLQQLADLAEAGRATRETLFYNLDIDQWAPISSQPELVAAMFPEKKRLALKAKEINKLNQDEAGGSGISVDDMLAAAEGRTAETASKKDPTIAMAQAARMGMWAATLSLLAAAAGEALPSFEPLMALDMPKLLTQPLAFLGVVDLYLAVMLALGVVSFYPFVRFRAAFGVGLTGWLFYTEETMLPFLLVLIGSVGLYLSTVVLHRLRAVAFGLLGVGGMGTFAWQMLGG